MLQQRRRAVGDVVVSELRLRACGHDGVLWSKMTTRVMIFGASLGEFGGELCGAHRSDGIRDEVVGVHVATAGGTDELDRPLKHCG